MLALRVLWREVLANVTGRAPLGQLASHQDVIDEDRLRERRVQAVQETLVVHARELRELHHTHPRLDVNARHLIAVLVVEAIESVSTET